MTGTAKKRSLRLWPGVVLVVLQLTALYAPGVVAPGTIALFYGMLGSLVVGTPLLLIWWLVFSRARWGDRIGGLVLLIVAQTAAVVLADPSAKMVSVLPGLPWLWTVFVASLFFGKRAVTVLAVLVAGLGWTLVRTAGVTGTMDTDLAWRWSATKEEQFLASDKSVAPVSPTEVTPEATSSAWPGFRGPDRDNVVAGVSIGTDWSANPPREIWRRPVGPGWGSFSFWGNRLCTQEQRDRDEVVVCYDAATGEPIWLHADAARFWEILGGAGPRATPTYHDTRLYTLGATGVLNALDATTGKPFWTRNIAEDTGASVPEWGFSSSPLVVDGQVIVHAAGAPDGRSVVAYDLASGEPRWFGQAAGPSYSSPHLTMIDGVRQIVMITQEGAFGLEIETGGALWTHEWPTGGGSGERVVQPAILENGGILIGTPFLGTRRFAVSSDASGTWTTREEWTSRGLKPYFNDLVVHRGIAYGFDPNIMAAIDVETGERVWKGGRYGNGQVLLLADQDLLLVLSEEGELALVRASPERFEEIAKIPVFNRKTWNHPIIVDGVVYLRNAEEAAAYRLPQ